MSTPSRFSYWRERFFARSKRPDPIVDPNHNLPADQAAAIAWSLARFQVGESNGGQVARDIWRIELPGVDDDYRASVGFFVAEEHRHGRILAAIVRSYGGEVLANTWSEDLFRVGRRLLGIRLKMLVLLAAEVIGIGFYGAIVGKMGVSSQRAALAQVIGDEAAHLTFHAAFFRKQTRNGLSRLVFRLAWWSIAHAACLVVLWDHRKTLRTLNLPILRFTRRLHDLIRIADRSVVAPRRTDEDEALQAAPHNTPLDDHLRPPRAA